MFKKFSILAFLIVLVLIGAQSCSKTEKKEIETKQQEQSKKQSVPSTVPGSIGSRAADFTLNNLEGKPVNLSDFKGKVILLNFWATWCPPCKAEIPGFIEMYQKYKNEGFEIVGVTGFRDRVNQVESYSKNTGINYPILFTKPQQVEKLITSYGGFQSIPTSFLIDREGIIQHIWVGMVDEEEFLKIGQKYLN
ncbi:MAG: TlpA family protein disulfide reductase [Candidatus Marinimicrobia bacterium]|nr:TlpA family protein disulfide reductase [Candidatus Neomarinimicrobiota bacterium]